MALQLSLTCISSALILHDDEVTLRRKRTGKQKKKNPRSQMMTWALVCLTKYFCNIK
uniref:Uncharacterized protein n=1 Tax=Vombatus ursinus TaxID=29139 RepID=A0A4X2K052_VOMUR